MAKRKKVFAIVAALAVLAVAIGLAAQYNKESRAAVRKTAAAVPVTLASVVSKTIPVRLYAIGNVEPYTTVAVKARVDGQIISVHFNEGDEVRQGALLFEIDPRPFAAALEQVQANLVRDKALLNRAADQEKRYKDLLEKNFISPDAYGQVKTNMESAAATLRADEAAVASAKLQLEYCSIRSPITGYAGKIAIQRGNLIKANDTNPLVTINQVVPIYVSFSIPERSLSDVRMHQAKGDLRVQANIPHAPAPLEGKLIFVDNSADLTTGTIKLKATFPNTDKTMWPGQFVNVAVTLYEQTDAIVTPATSVQNGPSGQYVFVVKPDQTVEMRPIKVARTEGDDAVVASGLKVGDRVVTVGQLRLAPGTRIEASSAPQTS
ncbi:MAG TPA: efflux RND transporter periplasmic adaptor subunit [Casimicrobiaceae bacterium]|jgi:multidrug efflux system membrane fusion protein